MQGNAPAMSDTDRTEIGRKVRAASTSFYGAMRILPSQQREAIYSVYAFCRAVDDIADDETASTDDRRRDLKRWRMDIEKLFSGVPDQPVTRALAAPVERFGLNKQDFIDVIDGMELDAAGPIVAPDAETLAVYCDRVASAVGRLCVCIFGEPGANGLAVAKHLGMALQLTNILRDVAEDAAIGRLYLPQEVLSRHGIEGADAASVMRQPGYAAAWRDVAGQAAAEFERAEAALAACNRRRMRAARIMLEVYKRNLQRMRALSDGELADPAVGKRLVGKAEKILIALRHGLV